MHFVKKGFLSLTSFALIACGGSSKNEVSPENQPPVMSIQAPQSVLEQSPTQLIATASDSDGSIKSYQWQQVSGLNVTLTNPTQATLSFTSPTVLISEGKQALQFALTVTDNENAQTTEQVTLEVTPVNQAPTITIEAPTTINEATATQFIANATDTDGTIKSYHWQQISGPNVTLTNTTQATLSFISPDIPDNTRDMVLTFKLTVADNEDTTSEKEVSITVLNQLNINVETQIVVKSAAFTLLKWSLPESDISKATLEQIDTGETIAVTMVNNNQAYFHAPFSATETLDSQFKLTVTTTNQITNYKIIDVTTEAPKSQFSDVKTLYQIPNNGKNIDKFDMADMNNDGLTDIVAMQENGIYWYKNMGDMQIDFSPIFITEIESGSDNIPKYYKLHDITNDGLIDFIFYQDKKLMYVENQGSEEFALQPITITTFNDDNAYRQLDMAFINLNQNHDLILISTDKINLFQHSNGTDFNSIAVPEFSGRVDSEQKSQHCKLANNSVADIFFIGGTTNKKSLYALRTKSDFKTLEKIYSIKPTYPNESLDLHHVCLTRQGNSDQMLLQDRNISKEVIYNETSQSYTVQDIESSFDKPIPGYSGGRVEVKDVNKDGLDDILVFKDSYDRDQIQQAFIRDHAENFSFPRLDIKTRLPNSQLFYHHEKASYAYLAIPGSAYHPIYNTLEILLFNQPNHTKSSIEFPQKKKLLIHPELDQQNIAIHHTGRTGEGDVMLMAFNDNTLLQNGTFDLSPFSGQIPKSADLNNDGLLDAVYNKGNFSEDEYTHVATRLNSPQGYEAEQIQVSWTTSSEWDSYPERAFINRIADLNNDGFLDLGIGYRERWYAFNKDDNNYLITAALGNYDSNDGYSRNADILDFNGDGLNDYLTLSNFSMGASDFVGGLQINLAKTDGTFEDTLVVEVTKAEIQRSSFFDINLDGKDDIAIYSWPGNSQDRSWYSLDANDQVIKKPIIYYKDTDNWKSPDWHFNHYNDLDGTGNPYFISKNHNGHINYYTFNHEIQSPVVSEIKLMPNNTLDLDKNSMMRDIDLDGDLDFIYWDEDTIYLIKNLYN